MLEWFLPIICSRNHPTLCFWLRRKGRQMPNTCSVMIRSNYPESHNKYLRKYMFKIFPDSHWLKQYVRKKQLPSFCKHEISIFISCLRWSAQWIAFHRSIYYVCDHEFDRIVCGEAVQSSAMDVWTNTFSNWLFGTLFQGNHFQNYHYSVILQKYQLLASQFLNTVRHVYRY